MTTIAWDGQTLAADRRCSFGAYIGSVTKIRRIGDCLVGCGGTAAKAVEFFAWFAAGADPTKYPKRDQGEDYFTGIVIRPGPVIERYEVVGHPIHIETLAHALGSGRDFAAMAMHLGHDAVHAVELASVFDENSGNGVDWLEFECGGSKL